VATRRQKIEVGAFLTIAAALLVIVLVALIGVRRTDLKGYRLEFQEPVSGLTEGSKVTYQGVPVGEVTDLVINQEHIVCVKIGIEPRKIVVREGVHAKLTMETVFGPIAVDLFYPADKHQPPLAAGSLIPTEPSLIAVAEASVPQALQKLSIVMTRIDQTLAAIEPERIGKTVDNLSSAVERFDATLSRIRPDDVGQIIKDVDRVLKSTDAGLRELRGDLGTLSTQLEGAVKRGGGELTKTTVNINASLERLNKAVDDTKTLVQNVNQVVEQHRKTFGSSLEHIDSILAKADKQFGEIDFPAAGKSFSTAAKSVGTAADSITEAAGTLAQTRNDLRQSLDNVERSVTRTLDELERTLKSARSLINYLERDPSSIIRGKPEPQRK